MDVAFWRERCDGLSCVFDRRLSRNWLRPSLSSLRSYCLLDFPMVNREWTLARNYIRASEVSFLQNWFQVIPDEVGKIKCMRECVYFSTMHTCCYTTTVVQCSVQDIAFTKCEFADAEKSGLVFINRSQLGNFYPNQEGKCDLWRWNQVL